MKFFTILLTFACSIIYSQVGINTETPQKDLHVNGALQITNELNVGGSSIEEGNAGGIGQVLVSKGANAAPAWENVSINSTTSGVLSGIRYYRGTTQARVNRGTTVSVPGLTFTITIPTTVVSQTLNFTVVGYALSGTNGVRSQGVFGLYQGNTKLTSAFASVADHTYNTARVLLNLPIPTSLMFQRTLTPGTYTFSVRYTSWDGSAIVNRIPAHFVGYNNDNESMLSRMQVMIFNN